MSLETEAGVFARLFKKHLNDSKQAQIRFATCKDVDWDNGTMTAADENDLAFHNVALGLGAMMYKPVVGCDCIVLILEGDESVSWLLYADEVDEIVFRDGKNGGLANTPELKIQLEKLTARVDGIIDAINNAVPVAQDGGVALQGTMVAKLTTLTDKEDFSNIEDVHIKH
jgi:hypothetical protein